MTTGGAVLVLGIGVLLAAGAVVLRVKSDGKLEIRSGDLAFLVLPLVLFGVVTGKVKGLDLFGIKADLSELFKGAARSEIGKQVAPTESATPSSVQNVVHAVETAAKGGVADIPQLAGRRVEGLTFSLGQGGYSGPAIRTYLDALSGSSGLRFVILLHRDGTFFGLYRAGDLASYLRVVGEQGSRQLQELLNSGDASARERLARLPGFSGLAESIPFKAAKVDALRKMEELHVDSLPVVDDAGRFKGTVERGALTTAMILEVTSKLANPDS